MRWAVSILCLSCFGSTLTGSNPDSLSIKAAKNGLVYKINENGSHYIQATLLNQTWLRFNQSNPGSTLFQKNAPSTFDVGLRRTRIQLFGQVNDRSFIYFQFGQNNFNNTAGYNTPASNRKIAAFFHDALCEFKLSKGNQLKIGAGLTVLNGLSRFSRPSIGTILSLDVPVFLQYSVDQIDQFDRRLAVYCRGLVKQLDYRIYVSNPFPVNTNGQTPAPFGANATFVNTYQLPAGGKRGINNQYGAYFAWNFFEPETHTTPYMTGTYLGAKKVLNIALGAVYQKDATWRGENYDNVTRRYNDTVFEKLFHLGTEVFLDVPLNKEKLTAMNLCAGYYITNYGKNYLRYNGLMNTATGSTATNLVQAGAYGNAFPMFGTGQVVYFQTGYLLSKSVLGKNGRLMPYFTAQYADYFALQNKPMLLLDAGINWFISGHQSKVSIDFQSRPTYYTESSKVKYGSRKNGVIIQYQVFF